MQTRSSGGTDNGYCPESMSLKRMSVQWIELLDDGELRVSDREGNTETFHLENES